MASQSGMASCCSVIGSADCTSPHQKRTLKSYWQRFRPRLLQILTLQHIYCPNNGLASLVARRIGYKLYGSQIVHRSAYSNSRQTTCLDKGATALQAGEVINRNVRAPMRPLRWGLAVLLWLYAPRTRPFWSSFGIPTRYYARGI